VGPPLPGATRGLGAAAFYDVAGCIRPRRAVVNLADRGSVYRTSQNPTLKPNLPSKEEPGKPPGKPRVGRGDHVAAAIEVHDRRLAVPVWGVAHRPPTSRASS
jgi:hypothetical protein